MKKYTQLSQDERYEIYATLKSKSSIAGGVSKSMLRLNEAIIDIKEG